MKCKKAALIVLFNWAAFFLFANATQPKVSVLTCGPGEALYSMYGHNALRLKWEDGRDLVFNYGTFDFQTPFFAIKFLRGKLPYYLTVSTFRDFIAEYEYDERSVTEQIVKLDSAETERIVGFLEENMRPENRAYKYDFFYDNCATRIYDVLQAGTSRQIEWKTNQENMYTFRDIIKAYQNNFPWTDFGIDIIIGAKADQPATVEEEMFIPDFVKYHLEEATYNGSPIISKNENILVFRHQKMPAWKRYLTGPVLLFSLLLFLELIWLSRPKSPASEWKNNADKIWYGVLTFIGIVVIIMWFLTDHEPTKNNWNVIWSLPMAGIFFKKIRESKVYFTIINILLMVTIFQSFQMSLLPQAFHPVFGMIAAISLLKMIRMRRDLISAYTRE